jgi:DNA-binding Lrp family transcriptional regulator
MTNPAELDGIDLKILSELQKDGRIRNGLPAASASRLHPASAAFVPCASEA